MATHHDDLELGAWTDAQLARLDRVDSWQPDAVHAFAEFQHGARRGARRSRRWALAAVLVTVMSVGVMAFPPAHDFADRCIAACVDQSNRLGAYLRGRTAATSGNAHALLAEPARLVAPDFSLADRSGRAISISGYRDQVVLLNFWATWCGPCKREVPWLIEFQSKYKDRGFTVVGLSLDEDGWTSVARYADDERINYPIALATDEVTGLYGGVGAVPMTFVIDRDGRIASTHLGLLHKDDVEREIGALLAR